MAQTNNLWSKLLTAALNGTAAITKPFAKGANILAQGYGDLYRGLSGNTQAVSPLESYIKSGISQEEMNRINEKPYQEILKSGAGMAATLAPMASKGLRSANIVKDALPNKWLQSISQGLLEGGLGGYGNSRPGYEAQDTIMGGMLGVGGELAGRYLGDRSFREMLADPDVARLQNVIDDAFGAGNIDNSAYQKLAKSTPSRGRALDYIQDNVEAISNATPTTEGQTALRAIQDVYGQELGSAINMPEQMYSKALEQSMGNYMGAAQTVKSIPEVSILNAKIQNGIPVDTQEVRNVILKLLDSVGLDEYPTELQPAISRLSGTKGGEQKIFELVRDYVTKAASGM